MTGWVTLTLGLAALAGTPASAELEIERARAAMEAGSYERALLAAERALEADPASVEARRLLLKSAQQAQWLPVAESRLQASRQPEDDLVLAWWEAAARPNDPEARKNLFAVAQQHPDLAATAVAWTRWRAGEEPDLEALPSGDPLAFQLRLRDAVQDERWGDLARLGRSWWVDQPRQPQVLEELFAESRDPAGPLRGQQRWVLRRAQAQLPPEDPVLAYRLLRLLIGARAKEDAAAVAAWLEASGEAPVLPRSAYNPTMQRSMGKALARYEDPVLPPGPPEERVGTLRTLMSSLHAADRLDEALEVLQEWADQGGADPRPWLDALTLLEDAGTPQRLAQLARQAALSTALPWAQDPGQVDLGARATTLVRALSAEAAAQVQIGAAGDGRVLAWLAALVDPHPARQAAWAGALAAEADAKPSDPALAGFDALSRLPPEQAGAHHDEILAILQEGLSLPPPTLADALIHQLSPLDGELQRLRAGRYEQAGFVLSARALRALAGPKDAEGEAIRRQVAEGASAVPAALAALHTESGQEGDLRKWPRVGRPMPPWTVDVAGEHWSEQDRGQRTVIALWASWCGPCQQELPELDRWLAERREAGEAVRAVAVSLDRERRAYERAAARLGLTHLTTTWKPEWETEFRVSSLPTTWVLDGEGIVSWVQVGYDPAFVRQLNAGAAP